MVTARRSWSVPWCSTASRASSQGGGHPPHGASGATLDTVCAPGLLGCRRRGRERRIQALEGWKVVGGIGPDMAESRWATVGEKPPSYGSVAVISATNGDRAQVTGPMAVISATTWDGAQVTGPMTVISATTWDRAQDTTGPMAVISATTWDRAQVTGPMAVIAATTWDGVPGDDHILGLPSTPHEAARATRSRARTAHYSRRRHQPTAI